VNLFIFFNQRNWVLATNSDFLIPISFEPYIINLWYFKLIFSNLSNRSHSLKCQMSTPLDYKDIGIRKLEFVTKTQFLCSVWRSWRRIWTCWELGWRRLRGSWSSTEGSKSFQETGTYVLYIRGLNYFYPTYSPTYQPTHV